MSINTDFAIVGAGLAGCECALTLARAGYTVTLFEQKPSSHSEAHVSPHLAELVCSNSLRSNEITSGPGLLKEEMRQLDSIFMQCADQCRVPADRALAVDRSAFSQTIEARIAASPGIRIINRQIRSIDEDILRQFGPRGVIIAAGPLASDELAASLAAATGQEYCYFYDAIAPVVWTDSLDMNVVFRASRHQQDDYGVGDYLNCPMSREEYFRFYESLLGGKTYQAREFEQEKHFEGCMPIEALAARGPRTLNFGSLKPIGFIDPRTGKRPWAVLQLRAETADMRTCNLVGCQTKLLQGEQQRIFRLIPGLGHAEFVRYGSMHRNTYVNAPRVLNPDLSLKVRPEIYLAGQITGVEGYIESAATGLWLGLMLAAKARGGGLPPPPAETALGALLNHLQAKTRDFQPSNINFGLFPPPHEKIAKRDRKQYYANRALAALTHWQRQSNIS